MRAIILAAGEGNRLRPHTLDRPKCMVELAGVPLVQRQLQTLRQADVQDITLATGYLAETLKPLGLDQRHNPDYASTNMVSTLMCAADLLDGNDDVIIAYGDIVYEPNVIEALLACPEPFSTTVDLEWQKLWELRNENPLTDAETLRLDKQKNILELGKKPKSLSEIEAQYMGLIKVTALLAGEIVKFYNRLDKTLLYDGKDFANMYMTSFLQSLIDAGHPLRAVPVNGGWLEIDTVADLQLFEQLHQRGELAHYCRLN